MNEFLVTRQVKARLDATDGKAIGSYNLVDPDTGLRVVIPNGAKVTRATYDVGTTFTSSTDAATIALTLQSAGDIKAAIAISASGDVYDAGPHEGLPGNFALDGNALTAIAMAAARSASYIKLTADRTVVATVAVEALTAGVLDLVIDYYL